MFDSGFSDFLGRGSTAVRSKTGYTALQHRHTTRFRATLSLYRIVNTFRLENKILRFIFVLIAAFYYQAPHW